MVQLWISWVAGITWMDERRTKGVVLCRRIKIETGLEGNLHIRIGVYYHTCSACCLFSWHEHGWEIQKIVCTEVQRRLVSQPVNSNLNLRSFINEHIPNFLWWCKTALLTHAVFGNTGNISPRIQCSKGFSLWASNRILFTRKRFLEQEMFLTDIQDSYSFSYIFRRQYRFRRVVYKIVCTEIQRRLVSQPVKSNLNLGDFIIEWTCTLTFSGDARLQFLLMQFLGILGISAQGFNAVRDLPFEHPIGFFALGRDF